MSVFQIIFVPGFLVMGVAVLKLSAKHGESHQRKFLWAGMWFFGAVLVAFPDIANWFAAVFGIGRGTDLLVYVGIISGIAVSRFFYIKLRQIEVMLTELVRQAAIRDAQLGQGDSNSNRDQ
jgi:hypothetical protein